MLKGILALCVSALWFIPLYFWVSIGNNTGWEAAFFMGAIYISWIPFNLVFISLYALCRKRPLVGCVMSVLYPYVWLMIWFDVIFHPPFIGTSRFNA